MTGLGMFFGSHTTYNHCATTGVSAFEQRNMTGLCVTRGTAAGVPTLEQRDMAGLGVASRAAPTGISALQQSDVAFALLI